MQPISAYPPSKDGLNWLQARKFANRFQMTNLRQENGIWIADDDGEPYRITSRNYNGAIEDGDLSYS